MFCTRLMPGYINPFTIGVAIDHYAAEVRRRAEGSEGVNK